MSAFANLNKLLKISTKTNVIPTLTNSRSYPEASRRFTVSSGRKMSSSAPVTEEQIRNKLINELKASHVDVRDESDGCGGKFSCTVVADKFEGKTLLQRHRLVNNILTEELKSIHAFSQKTYTPDQWQELNETKGN